MDPVTAIGLAGTVVQFISLGVKCTKAGWIWHKKDASGTATDLLELNKAIQQALSAATVPSSSHVDDDLCQLAEDCKEFSTVLMERLPKSGFLSRDPSTKNSSIPGKIVFTTHQLDEMNTRLGTFRDRLTVNLLSSLRQFAMQSLAKQEEMARALKLRSSGEGSLENNVRAILKHVSSTAIDSSGKQWQESLRQDMIQMIYSDQTMILNPAGDTEAIVMSPDTCDKLQKTLISTLRYAGMEDRKNNVTGTYERTFQWALQREQTEEQPWDNLPCWLESDDQIYWITGKAGSGKSTLMKFLCHDDSLGQPVVSRNEYSSRCSPFLAEWAGEGNDLIIASFYFWASEPDSRQTSRAALLRTLLYQVLLYRPQIIPAVTPSRWEALSILGNHRRMQNWSDGDLKTALYSAVRNLTHNGAYVSFFIDGLDEFSGDPKELISLVNELFRIDTRVKVCVASRPWVEFQDAFQSKPNLRLEHLTYEDIRDYVFGHFASHATFGNLQRRNPAFADQLVENVVSKASGVFLWVKLVVASLLAGISYGDRVEDLQRRLDFLPSDLESLYDRMLRDLDPFYHEHAAQMIMLIESVRESLPLTVFSFADEKSLASLQALPESHHGPTDLALQLDDTCRRLNSRCKGLIEVVQISYTAQNRRGSYAIVKYLHKTVKDFIQTEKMRLFLNASLKSSKFDPHLQLCIAFCAELKTGSKKFDENNIRQCFYHAGQVLATNETDMVAVIDHLGRISRFQSIDLLDRAVRERSALYLKAKLIGLQEPVLLNKLLTVAVQDSSIMDAGIIRHLLELGADTRRMWMELLRRIPSVSSFSALDEPSKSLVVAFVAYGASVEDGRTFYVRTYKNRFGSREITSTVKFSDAFFDELKGIEIVRKRPLSDRMSGWIRRKNLG